MVKPSLSWFHDNSVPTKWGHASQSPKRPTVVAACKNKYITQLLCYKQMLANFHQYFVKYNINNIQIFMYIKEVSVLRENKLSYKF